MSEEQNGCDCEVCILSRRFGVGYQVVEDLFESSETIGYRDINQQRLDLLDGPNGYAIFKMLQARRSDV